MDILFFLLSLLLAGIAYNLWRPIYAPSGAATASFFFGLIGNLFALHLFLACLALMMLFSWLNTTTSFIESLASVLLLGSAVAYFVFHLRGHNVQEVVEQSLQAGLGEDYLSQVSSDVQANFVHRVDLKTMLWPFPQDLPGVEILKDIAYGEDWLQKLDIYRKPEGGQLRPVLFQIHGGAWTEKMGSKNEQARPLMNHMALRDWICVSVGYRLSPSATMPEHIIDVKSALVWVKQNIADYGGDPNFIIATGGSAGGHLSSLLALSANDPDFQPDHPGVDTSVQGCVPYYGAVDFLDDAGHHPSDGITQYLSQTVLKQTPQEAPELWQATSPMRRVHTAAPPFLIVCGDKDTLVPVGSNAAFADALREASDASVCYADIGDAQHAFNLTRNPHSEYVVYGIERWLGYQYCSHLNN